MAALFLLIPLVAAEPPRRQVPAAVLADVRTLQSRFEQALAMDCDAARCFSKGCNYVAHTVADRPRTTSLPGLGSDPGPGSVEPQAFLTQAQCAFTYEDTVAAEDVQALTRRLQLKVSQGWTTVTVAAQPLQALPDYVRTTPESEPESDTPPEPVPAPEPPPPWTTEVAVQELWDTLLPHFAWMIAVVLGTLSLTTLIWAWRRVGQTSLEEQAFLAQLSQETSEAAPDGNATAVVPQEDEIAAFVAAQQAAWSARMADADPAISALAEELLRAGDLPLLAKAVLRFPQTLPAAFPNDGELGASKLALADYLKTMPADALPDDATFFEALNRHAMAATVISQDDAQLFRTLREAFGTVGMVTLIGDLPDRLGALLFVLSSMTEQREMVALMLEPQRAALASQLLRSNRMDPRETDALLSVLDAVRRGQPLTDLPSEMPISDRGMRVDAAGALSILLPNISQQPRSALLEDALSRFQRALPAWYHDILYADMVLFLPAESRTDLLLGLDVTLLNAWLAVQSDAARAALLHGAPNALLASTGAAPATPNNQQMLLAVEGRRALAKGLHLYRSRAGIPLEAVLLSKGAPTA